MKITLIRILIICTVMIFLIFIPFFPGKYDHLAVMVSSVTQIISFISLMLIPIGILWLIYQICFRKEGRYATHKSVYFAITALGVFILAIIFASFAAIGGVGSFRGSLLLGFSLPLAFFYILISRIIPKLKRMKDNNGLKLHPTISYLIIIPLVTVGIRTSFIIPATEYSRNLAIEQSKILIQDLENYYLIYGEYPLSLQGLWQDYETGVIGIEKYEYEPNGEAYNIFFESFTFDLFAREIVMYNKLDEHIIRSHPSFIFKLSPQEFSSYRGYFMEESLPHQHWKYYLFD
jgi:hypothetical protein